MKADMIVGELREAVRRGIESLVANSHVIEAPFSSTICPDEALILIMSSVVRTTG